MSVDKGSRLGAYEVLSRLGAGGMGEVWRARDPRLGRDVAIKLLPDGVATDPERLARFEREAKLLASLQHPNIAVLHGLEESEGRRFLVMQCIEGESLAERLARGAVPLADALEIAVAIAAGLEAAHEAGVIHRDLKPGNVMVTPAGDVKVLDFGLAKGGAGASSSDVGLSASPTMTYASTQAGVILGTAAYMSPEQARGKPVDRRTDIWSFGCVLYELLTGRQAFAGETVSDIVARILQTEPDWDALPAATPGRVRDLIARCLQKDARRRLRDIGDARLELEDLIAGRVSASGAHTPPPATLAPTRPWLVPALAALVVVAAAAAWFAARALGPAAPAEPTRFSISAPHGQQLVGDESGAVISPDGRAVAMIAADSSGTTRVWVRRLDALTPRVLPGTENVTLTCWSPDGKWIAFCAGDRQLSKVALAGGDPQPICAVKSARGMTWGPDGTILVAPYAYGGIYRVSANGGDLASVLQPDTAKGETGLRFPMFLPDGKHFLFSSLPADSTGKGRVCVATLDGRTRKTLLHAESAGWYMAPGWLLHARGFAVLAQRFDLGALAVRGDAVPLGDLGAAGNFAGEPVVSGSRTGTLAYATYDPAPQRLAWFDAQGRETAGIPMAPGLYYRPVLSPDARRALMFMLDAGQTPHLMLVDLERGVVSQLTPSEVYATDCVWSPDGQRFATIEQNLGNRIVIRSLVDDSQQVLLAKDATFKKLDQWTPDGKALIVDRLDSATKWDTWWVPVDGGAPRPLLRSPANENGGAVSPDGRWLAYVSDVSGTQEVNVVPLGAPGMHYQVTNGGGGGPTWSRDGKRFGFAENAHPNVLMVAPVLAGDAFTLGKASPQWRIPDDVAGADIDRDFTHVIALKSAEGVRPQTATVVQNWSAALRKP